MEIIRETNLDLTLIRKGKVRDTYELGDELLMVATDRMSAFDVVFKEGIPRKGEVLNNLSAFWFEQTNNIIENHFISTDMPDGLPGYLQGRSMIVKSCGPVMLECVVRGYITGSAWKEYQMHGTVCGIELPCGLDHGSELPEPLFTPSTKAEVGHDQNVTEEHAEQIIGKDIYETVKKKSLELYNFGKKHAFEHGLVLADTKFEFGEHDGHVILIDEALTPDSSRYWLKEKYDIGILESVDKQYLRDYLEKTKWNKEPPAPKLPEHVVSKTSERYLLAYKMLTGKEL
ncbi:MAG: phosphoribosylaminoimidazolesuccinocarboxamide synthase [Candidatus Micrarchaeota archaeon]